jgi:hypothetical protein
MAGRVARDPDSPTSIHPDRAVHGRGRLLRAAASALFPCFLWSGTAVAFARCCGTGPAGDADVATAAGIHAGHTTSHGETDPQSATPHDCDCLAGCCAASPPRNAVDALFARLPHDETVLRRAPLPDTPLLAPLRFELPLPRLHRSAPDPQASINDVNGRRSAPANV